MANPITRAQFELDSRRRPGLHRPVPMRGSSIRYWLPVVLWMALIFSASTDVFSAEHTSRFIGPFLRWFAPDLSDETVRQVQLGVRKTAHVLEYAILAALLWRALRRPRPNDPRPWSWPLAATAIALAIAYAVTDELHQGLVASRYGSAVDVLIDSAGAVLGVGLIYLFRRRRCCKEACGDLF